MKHKPFILIAASTQRRGVEFADASINLSNRYPAAVLAAGGIPWIAPCAPWPEAVAELVRRSDGIMLTGGDDVQPKLYTRRLPSRLAETVGPVEPDRDGFELLLIDEVHRQRKPLLAICRGQQMLNVALGGTLIVDIARQVPGALDHRRLDRKDQIVHEVQLTPGSLLATIAGKTMLGVNSSHHQAVGRVGKTLRATARSADGIIEGLELASSEEPRLPYLLGVQFHPERLFDRHAQHLELFRSFTRACVRSRRKSV